MPLSVSQFTRMCVHACIYKVAYTHMHIYMWAYPLYIHAYIHIWKRGIFCYRTVVKYDKEMGNLVCLQAKCFAIFLSTVDATIQQLQLKICSICTCMLYECIYVFIY